MQRLDPVVRSLSPTYKWRVVAMLWLVCLLNYADRQAIYSVFPLLKSEMHLSDVQLGIIGSSFMWVYAAALPLAGWIGDRVSRKNLILGGLIFWSLVTLATALSAKYWQLVVFRSLEGLGEAFYFPASMSLISDYHGPQTRSKAMGLHQSSVYAGTVLGGTAAGVFAQYYGWRLGFYVFGASGVVLGMLLLGALKEPSRGRADRCNEPGDDPPAGLVESLSEVLRLPMVRLLIAVFVGSNFVAAIFLTWMPSYLSRRFDMSLSMSGLNATLWLQAMSMAGVVVGGIAADRAAGRVAAGRVLVQSLGLLAGAPFIFLTGWTLRVPLLVLAMAGFGWFKGFYDASLWASLYDVVPIGRRAAGVGVMNAIGWFGAGAAPVIVAAASRRFGLGACLSAASFIYIGCGLLLLCGARLLPKSMRNASMGGVTV